MNDFHSVATEFRSAQVAGDRDRLSAVLHHDVVWVLAGEHLVSTMTIEDHQITRIDTYLSDLDMMDAYFV